MTETSSTPAPSSSSFPFTVDRARSLEGPEWLSALRVEAAERFAAEGLPSTAAEEWRYSRIDRIQFDGYEPSSTALRSSGGVAVLSGATAGPELWGAAIGDRSDAFVDLNTAFAPDALLVDVPAGTEVVEPIEIDHLVAAGSTSFARVVIRAGDNSSVTVVERSGVDDVDALSVPVTEILVGRDARVRHVGLQQFGPSVVEVGRVAARVEAGGRVELFHVALGGGYARTRFDCRLVGRGASGDISAIYLGDGDQIHDLRTFQDHEAPDTTSDLAFKGVIDDRAHAVYTGLIRISHDAPRSNANQSNRVIKLSADAWAESVPNLEIHHNAVRCSHASSVGPIEPDQRFYLESRGVEPDVAERLIVAGFLGDLVGSIPVASVAAAAADHISRRLS